MYGSDMPLWERWRRILRPGGRFRFVEHVAAPRWSPRRWPQRGIRRPWRWLYKGCTLDRDTGAAVRPAGFSEVQRERFHRSAFVPVNTAIWRGQYRRLGGRGPLRVPQRMLRALETAPRRSRLTEVVLPQWSDYH